MLLKTCTNFHNQAKNHFLLTFRVDTFIRINKKMRGIMIETAISVPRRDVVQNILMDLPTERGCMEGSIEPGQDQCLGSISPGWSPTQTPTPTEG